MPEKVAEQYREQMAKPDLVFLTKINGERVMQAVKVNCMPACEGDEHAPDCPNKTVFDTDMLTPPALKE